MAGNSCEELRGFQSISLAEHLARQFYDWEIRGRGWLVWDEPVRVEPPFQPFWGYYLPTSTAGDDDGRRQTWGSGFIQWLSRKLIGRNKAKSINQPQATYEAETFETIRLADPSAPIELQITLRPDAKIDAEATKRFLLSLGSCRSALSFELVGMPDSTVIQFACGVDDLPYVRGQLQAHFPDAAVTHPKETLKETWNDLESARTTVIDFGLSQEFILPLALPEGDILAGLAGTLEELHTDELAMLQVLFEPVRRPWAASILRAVANSEGESWFEGTTDLLDQAKDKIASPLFATVIRVACRAPDADRSKTLSRRLGHGLDLLANPMGNELIALDNKGYDLADHAADVPLRQSRRSGMILNLDELATLVHLPAAEVRSAKLGRKSQRTRPAPACILQHELLLGENEHAGRIREVTLSTEQRVRHMHVVGASGTGKSTFLLNLILQDITHGQGLAVLDPHGDLIDAILDRIPADRVADVVLFDPGDEAYPVGFNVLAAHSETEKTLVSSDLVGIFRRLSTSWGDQMNAVLSNAILAFLESDRGGTLADLRRFLVERSFREEYLQSVRDPHIVYYWRKEFPLQVGRSQGSVLTRLDTFLRPKPIRHIVAQRENRLDFADIMDHGKIFLARLAHGAIGEENTYLLGSLLVSKFHQIAIGRQQVKEEKRRHFWLYVDEFHHFATPSMASLLSGVRKYRLGLVLAHQEMHQLESRSPEVASAILSNSYTRVCFRVGEHDARKLKEGLSNFDAGDLQNLSTGEAVCRVERSEFDFNLRTKPLNVVADVHAAANIRSQIIATTRERYATDRAIIEAQLREATPVTDEEPPPPKRKQGKREWAQTPPVNESAPAIPAQTSSTVPAVPPATEPIASPVSKRSKVAVPVPPEEKLMGRGGPEHKYLQQLVKQWGDGMGFRATIEREILDGQGSVDVALERDNLAIACLISVTTPSDWELNSIRKCLKAKFSPVILTSPNAKHLNNLRKAIEPELEKPECACVQFLPVEEIFARVQELLIRHGPVEQTVRGYKVKRVYGSADPGETEDKKRMIAKAIADFIKRSKPK